MKLRKDMIAQNLLALPLVEMFVKDGDLDLEDHDLDLEDQDHLKYVKYLRSRSDLEDQDHAHL